MNLEEGITSQGETHRTYDKMGKRMWAATPKKDMSTKDKSIGAPSVDSMTQCVDGDTPRGMSNVGL